MTLYFKWMNYFRLNSLNLNWIISAYNECPDKSKFFNSFFNKLAGTDKLKEQIISGFTEQQIKYSWKNNLSIFNILRKKYLIN